MRYRRLGSSGLQVSELSLGSWVTYGNQVDESAAIETMAAAWDAGVNFFDNAEVYAGGKSETLMGSALKRLGWDRDAYIISTKFYWGINKGPNRKNTLNRKYLLHAIDGSLKRLQLDYVDLVFCHRPDPNTPIEETVWAMHDIVQNGKALYWGTSEWSALDIFTAWQIADYNRLHKPVMEQPQYNLFHRHRVEQEYAELYDYLGLGLTTWSPLASGVLTGKYVNGIPSGSRSTLPGYGWLQETVTNSGRLAATERLRPISDELGCTLSQLAIAWCASNSHVSTVITGASCTAQVIENMKAVEIIPRLNAELLRRIHEAVGAVGTSNSDSTAAFTLAENIEQALKQTVGELEEHIVSLRQAVAQAIASQKHIEQQYQQAQSQAKEWESRAAYAVSKNNDALAREASSRSKSSLETAVTLKSFLEQQNKTVGTLKTNLTIAEGKISEAMAKIAFMVTRDRSAKATEQTNTVHGFSSDSERVEARIKEHVATLEHVEEVIQELEARAQATSKVSTNSNENSEGVKD